MFPESKLPPESQPFGRELVTRVEATELVANRALSNGENTAAALAAALSTIAALDTRVRALET